MTLKTAAWVCTAIAFALTGCEGTIDDAPDAIISDDIPDAPKPYVPRFPFEEVPPAVYVTKVKNVLTGRAATAEEIDAVTADPSVLPSLVEKWFVTAEAQIKFRGLYGNMFQQGQVQEADLSAPLGQRGQRWLGTVLTQQFRDSFSYTVQKMVADHEPFSKTITTDTIYMTPPMMAYYLLADDYVTGDRENVKTPRHPTPDGKLHVWFEFVAADDPAGPLTLDESLNPSSPRYMHFAMASAYTCTQPVLDTANPGYVKYGADGKVVRQNVVLNKLELNPTTGVGSGAEQKLWQKLTQGTVPGAASNQTVAKGGPIPNDYPKPADVPIDKAADYKVVCPFSWTDNKPLADFTTATSPDLAFRPVKIVLSNEPDPTPFWDLKTLRSINKRTLNLQTWKVGFFSTPAFLGTFPSNASNDARGLTNQTLIVALGKSINPIDKSAATILDTGDDSAHSDPSSPCYSCHQTIDPLRNVFIKTWTYSGSQQLDTAKAFNTADFDFLDVQARPDTLADYAQVLVDHPLYAPAVVQKLCYYANSAECSDRDEEFTRIAEGFKENNYDFQWLVRELFSSPLVTGAAPTRTTGDRGEVVSIARYNHLCASLTNRLGLPLTVDDPQYNLCSGAAPAAVSTAIKNAAKATVPLVATNIASDGFARGAEAPLLPTDATMFFRSSAESLCRVAADFTVDVAGSKYSSTKKDVAIEDFVTNIAGLPANDPSYAAVKQVLLKHYDDALTAGANATDALKSTFVLSCTTPTALAIGL